MLTIPMVMPRLRRLEIGAPAHEPAVVPEAEMLPVD
jgi:hypothetical protein